VKATIIGIYTLADYSVWLKDCQHCLVRYSDLGPTVVRMRRHGALPGSVLSCHMRMVGDALLRGMQHTTLDACDSIDYLNTCITDFYIECVAFHHGMFTLCGGVMAHICVSLIELPLGIVMGLFPALEYMLSGPHGLLQPCLIIVR
jgi:hypothetical protein